MERRGNIVPFRPRDQKDVAAPATEIAGNPELFNLMDKLAQVQGLRPKAQEDPNAIRIRSFDTLYDDTFITKGHWTIADIRESLAFLPTEEDQKKALIGLELRLAAARVKFIATNVQRGKEKTLALLDLAETIYATGLDLDATPLQEMAVELAIRTFGTNRGLRIIENFQVKHRLQSLLAENAPSSPSPKPVLTIIK